MNRLLLLTIISLFFTNLSIQAQYDQADFEPAGYGAGWAWTVVENADNPPINIIANPQSGGINTSANVAEFTARAAGNPWALAFTDDIDNFEFDATNNIVKIKVYKTTISD